MLMLRLLEVTTTAAAAAAAIAAADRPCAKSFLCCQPLAKDGSHPVGFEGKRDSSFKNQPDCLQLRGDTTGRRVQRHMLIKVQTPHVRSLRMLRQQLLVVCLTPAPTATAAATAAHEAAAAAAAAATTTTAAAAEV
ncbi:hypothetical protein ACSSS7_000807 [Eimeria intestinalis]